MTTLARTLSIAAATAAAAGLAACGTPSAVPGVRFANAPPVFAVDDRRDVPTPPREREFHRDSYHLDNSFYKAADRALAMPAPRRALGVNALDEVPDSTWFTNRIGVRDISPAELKVGPVVVGTPEAHKPWTVVKAKQGGAAAGFIVEDARGEKFIIKLDRKGFPEVESGANIIVNRLLWAAGYHVPEDHLVHFTRRDLVVGKDATIEIKGKKQPLDAAMLEAIIARGELGATETIRATASRFLDGKPLGGHPAEGVRRDDPNDRIPHERRRDLRGAQAFFAWLDHNDIKEDNFVDTYVTDPANKQRRYVKHYMVDFGMALGASALEKRDPRESYMYRYDLGTALESLVTVGLAERNWEDRRHVGLKGVGLYDSKTFDPAKWKAQTPAYVPFLTSDRIDRFWASKIMMRFSRAHIRAVVEEARFSDPRAAQYLVDTIVMRQRKLAAYWFWRVSPLDDFTYENGRVCFADLMLRYNLAPEETKTRYRVRAHDAEGRLVASLPDVGPARGRTCTAPIALPRSGDGYTVVRIDTVRDDVTLTVFVHVARAKFARGPEVIGIWRK